MLFRSKVTLLVARFKVAPLAIVVDNNPVAALDPPILAAATTEELAPIAKVPTPADPALIVPVTEEELFKAVRKAYDNDAEFLMNARVLWIRRKENEDWEDRFYELVQE